MFVLQPPTKKRQPNYHKGGHKKLEQTSQRWRRANWANYTLIRAF